MICDGRAVVTWKIWGEDVKRVSVCRETRVRMSRNLFLNKSGRLFLMMPNRKTGGREGLVLAIHITSWLFVIMFGFGGGGFVVEMFMMHVSRNVFSRASKLSWWCDQQTEREILYVINGIARISVCARHVVREKWRQEEHACNATAGTWIIPWNKPDR